MGIDVIFVAVFILGALAGSILMWLKLTRKTSWGAFEVIADAGNPDSGNVNIRFPEEAVRHHEKYEKVVLIKTKSQE